MKSHRYIFAAAAFGLLSFLSVVDASATSLASDQVRILGVQLRVTPAAVPGAPKNVPLLLSTSLVDGNGDPAGALAEPDGLVSRSDLSPEGTA